MIDQGWIGVDLDGTLAHDEGWQGEFHIGEPIPKMLARVKQMLVDGKDVRIFTARVAHDETGEIAECIREWCRTHLGRNLPVTCRKDYACQEIWDDRAKQVIMNTGEFLEGDHAHMQEVLRSYRECCCDKGKIKVSELQARITELEQILHLTVRLQ